MSNCRICGKPLLASEIRSRKTKCSHCQRVPEIKKCPICGSSFVAKGTRVFCSDECSQIHHAEYQHTRYTSGEYREKHRVYERERQRLYEGEPKPRNCIICGKPFSPDKRHPHAKKCHACVVKLSGDHRNRGNVNRNRTCVVCGKDFEITVSGSQICCSSECSSERIKQKRRERYVPKEPKPVKTKEPKPMVTHTCEICGKVFENYQPVQFTCSGECKKERDKRVRKEYRKNNPRNHNRRQHERFTEEKLINKDITIKKLFMRDGGVCYLCGDKCNWNDLIRGNGWATAMGKYPTIDHVIPRAKGGEHSWENVKLACYECNTKKRDHFWLEDKQGQMRFAL